MEKNVSHLVFLAKQKIANFLIWALAEHDKLYL